MTQGTATPESSPQIDIRDHLGVLLDQAVFDVGIALHGRTTNEGMALDHLVSSPAGVDVVQIVSAAGRVRVLTAGLRHLERTLCLDERDATRLLLQLDAACADVEIALSTTAACPPVRGWLCLAGADWHGAPEHIRLAGFEVVSPTTLLRELCFEGRIGISQVVATVELLESTFPRHLSPDGGVGVPRALPRPDLPPAGRARVLAGAALSRR